MLLTLLRNTGGAPPSSTIMWLKVSGTWKQVTPFIKVAGTWRQATSNIKVLGTWK